MSLLNGYYSFQLQKLAGADTYILANTNHAGKHNDYFFDLLNYGKPVKFKKLEPVDISEGYVIYPLVYGNKGEENTIIFETEFSFLHPYGLVEIEHSPDCIMFQMFDGDSFDVWISEGNANQSSQLLNMLRNGELLDDMDSLLNRLEGGHGLN